MSWDKMVGRAVGPVPLNLGVHFLNRDLSMTVNDCKVARLLKLLNTEYSSNRRSFQALPAAVLIGNVCAATLTCSWLRWLLYQLIGAMKELMKRNYHCLAQSSHFTELFAEQNEQWLDLKSKSFACQLCPNPSILKEVWWCKFDYWLTSEIHEELNYIRKQCVEHLNGVRRWINPLSHFIEREPDASIWQDASTSWGMRGGSGQLQYWWQVRWETWSPKIYHHINELSKHHQDKLWTNELEFAAIVVNIFAALAVLVSVLENHHMDFDWQPLIHCGGDNKSAKCWSTKFSNSKKLPND